MAAARADDEEEEGALLPEGLRGMVKLESTGAGTDLDAAAPRAPPLWPCSSRRLLLLLLLP